MVTAVIMASRDSGFFQPVKSLHSIRDRGIEQHVQGDQAQERRISVGWSCLEYSTGEQVLLSVALFLIRWQKWVRKVSCDLFIIYVNICI